MTLFRLSDSKRKSATARCALFFAVNVILMATFLPSLVLAQGTRDGLSTADPASEGFSVQRLGEIEKAIQNGDFKQITSVLIARHGSIVYEHYFDSDGVDGLRNTRLRQKPLQARLSGWRSIDIFYPERKLG